MNFSIVFSSSGTFLSRTIRTLTRSKVSHCCVCIDFQGERCVIEADWSGVVVTPLKKFKEESVVECEFFPGVDLPGSAVESLGVPYDYLGLLGFVVVLMGRMLGKKWKNPSSGPSRVFCSESVVRILADASFPGASSLDPDMMSPQDVLEFCQETMG